MPRRTDSVPKYRKHKGTGQAVVTINGRDYYLGPHGTSASHLEYDRLISEWLASGRSSAYGVAKDSLTVIELIVYSSGFLGIAMRETSLVD